MTRRAAGLLVALIVVGSGFAWAARERPPHQRTPLDVGAAVDSDVRYGPAERHVLDVYTPTGEGPHPVVVYFHSGGWVEGDKSYSIPIWDWTDRGYAVVAANYTLAIEPGSIRDSVDSAETAVRFVVAEGERWDLDVDRLGVFGFSAGGHLVLTLSQRDLPLAAVGAPTNLVGLLDPGTPFFDGVTGEAVPALMQRRLGCSTDVSCVADAIELSPTEGVAGTAPMLIIHGERDLIVSSSHATDMAGALQTQGADVDLVLVADGGHWAESPALDTFFDRFLAPPGAEEVAGR